MDRAELSVEVVFAVAPRAVKAFRLHLPTGSTVADALQASGLILSEGLDTAVWGRRQPLAAPLRDGDRVEVLRALTVDPMEARRQRYRAQAPKKKRPGSPGA